MAGTMVLESLKSLELFVYNACWSLAWASFSIFGLHQSHMEDELNTKSWTLRNLQNFQVETYTAAGLTHNRPDP